ncbi:MAG: threonine--tRNA ligase [Candidatus Omnitrophica bacterium]|nr:threonine--tRNA ligase [Candidatus Omnitrophota bacterium]
MNDELHRLRHSAAHVTAQAVKRLWPTTKLAIGPPIEEGFYYDVETERPLAEEDLAAIEAEMAKIVQANLPFERSELTKEKAAAFFASRGEPFKVELIEGIPDPKVSLYTDGEFVDLCEGPHLKATGEIRAFKLLSLAGAYWRGSEKNPQLTRLYGTAFESQEELKEFLKIREEAKLRDHRKLGQALGLFTMLEEAGAGMVFYPPRGAVLRGIIEDYARRQHAARGYVPVVTPHVLKSDIWVRSGHYDYYKPNMYLFKVEEQEWGLKPMNCPGHILIYQSVLRSYRELPLRFFELGTVYRNEKSGVLHGLLRVRGFTQDDSHIFCRSAQLEEEIGGVLRFIQEAMRDFGFPEYKVEMSTRPPEFLGDTEQWDRAEAILTSALKRWNVPFELAAGAGAFYGPKIDVHVKDTLGRFWQCATVQLDFVLPKRFGLTYAESDGQRTAPVMIHRAVFGSLERFMGTLIEQYGGAFPAWLAPVQVTAIPITQDQEPYARETAQALVREGLRAETDDRRETLQARIRDAQLAKVPYMLVVGKREVAAGTVAVRSRAGGDLGAMPLAEFVKRIRQEVHDKK